ncbi:PPC domain-containing protein [sulfur-oxidizing endosymbiont of Gigantopelta aegis]|uniref:PPC domain-containing protein n=1 Tax=sulfur-oxidizing endosymbiont of Gigantopelta aegis TaxID=2794934 RepID=UPI0018DCC3A0|nr:PPC domain-containing protein [sulfur-oxidizing endosymbiont of Gigantopelta aegis]
MTNRFLLLTTISLMSSFASFTSAYAADTTSIYPEDTIVKEIDYKSWHFYKIEVDNPTKLTVKLRKISDDVDLYVSRSKKPTKNEFLCAPLKQGSSIETCRLTSHTAATWYIGVHGKLKSDYQLNVQTNDLNLLSQIN